MELAVRKLFIKGFRSFPQEQVALANPTFFVGQNGAGKSNLMDAFALVGEAMSASLQDVIERRGGLFAIRNSSHVTSDSSGIGIRLELGQVNSSIRQAHFAFEIQERPNYGFEISREQCNVEFQDGTRNWYDRRTDLFTTNVTGLAPFLQPTALTLPLVGGDARFAPVLHVLSRMRTYAIEPAKLRGPQWPRRGDILQTDGGNAASVLTQLERADKATLERMQAYLQATAPHVESVYTDMYYDEMLMLLFNQPWSDQGSAPLPSELMSDGTLRILGLLLAVFQPSTPSLLVLEEPEKTIHPAVLGAMMDLIHHASRIMQVIVTTHSPELLDAAPWLREEHLRMVVWNKGASRVAGVSNPVKESLQRHLMGAGELMRSNALEPDPVNTQGRGQALAEIELFEMLA